MATNMAGSSKNNLEICSWSPVIPRTLSPIKIKPNQVSQKSERLSSAVIDVRCAIRRMREAPPSSETLRTRLTRTSQFRTLPISQRTIMMTICDFRDRIHFMHDVHTLMVPVVPQLTDANAHNFSLVPSRERFIISDEFKGFS